MAVSKSPHKKKNSRVSHTAGQVANERKRLRKSAAKAKKKAATERSRNSGHMARGAK